MPSPALRRKPACRSARSRSCSSPCSPASWARHSVSAIFLIRERARTSAQNVELRARIADVNAALQRSEALLNLRDQRVVVWASENKKPELIGTLPIESGAPEDRAAFLAFGRWLMPRSAAALEHAVAGLREKAKPFDLVIESQAGAPLEVHGRKSAAHVLVRFVSLSETQRSQARLKIENQRLAADYDTMIGLLDALEDAVLAARGRRAAEMGQPRLCRGGRSRQLPKPPFVTPRNSSAARRAMRSPRSTNRVRSSNRRCRP